MAGRASKKGAAGTQRDRDDERHLKGGDQGHRGKAARGPIQGRRPAARREVEEERPRGDGVGGLYVDRSVHTLTARLELELK